MRLEHSFTVPVPVEDAWRVLLDLPRVAPCLPGATLTGVDGDTFTGTVKVKLGPITLTYQGKGRFVERDEAARRVVVEASGRDVRAAGTASATVSSTLVPDGAGTRVEVLTDLAVTGRPAQFGRGMIGEVSAKLIGQFADCLAQELTVTSAPPPAAQPTTQQVAAPATEPMAEPMAEPIDLIRLTGGTATARRLAAFAAAAVLAVLAWLGLRRKRRARH